MSKYKIFYVDRSNRIQAIMLGSFKTRINWVQDGLGIVSWRYNFVGQVQEDSLSGVYRKLCRLVYDRRKKKNIRPIGIGDIICVDNEYWFITTAGFQRIPDILVKKIEFFSKKA